MKISAGWWLFPITYYKSLDGEWKFYWVPKPSEIPADFYAENYDDSRWETIPVPATGSLTDNGIPMYVMVVSALGLNRRILTGMMLL